MGRPLTDDRAAAIATLHAQVADRLAAHVYRLRQAKGWSQEEAAWHAARGVRFYQRVEAADAINATLNTVARLALGFGVDVVDLLAATPPPPARRPRGRAAAPAGPRRDGAGVRRR